MGGFFSMRFEGEDRVSGQAAPNRYSAPCSWGDDSDLAIGPAAATKMLLLREPEGLGEDEFFGYLSRAYRCSLDPGGRLELRSQGPGGEDAVLIFRREL
jgi:heat shock protein HslJ